MLSLSTLMAAVDTNIVNIGLPTISQTLHTGFSSVQWVMLSYMLAVTALIVGVGRIADILGKKGIFLIGVAVFTAAALGCGLSRSIGMLIAMRALQGAGGAVLMALSFALVGDLMPREKILGSMAMVTAMLPVGFALGPTVGGVLLHFFSWRALFFFNIPLGVAAFALALLFPPLPPVAAGERFDLAGMLLLTVALSLYVLGITRAEDTGFTGSVAALFAGAALLLGGFLVREHWAAEPLVRLSMFRGRTFSASLAVSVLVYTVITGNWLIVPFYLQQGLGYSTLTCGLLMTVGPVGCTIFTPVASRLAARFGSFRVMNLGVLAFTAGTFAMATLSLHTGVARFAVTLFCFNGSLAFFQTPNNAEVIASARPEQRGVASGLLNLSRTVGQVTGTAAMGAVFYRFAGTRVLAQATPAQIVTGIRVAYFTAGFVAVAGLLIGLVWLTPRRRAAREDR